MAKRKVTRKKNNSDVSIKVKNIGRLIREAKKEGKFMSQGKDKRYSGGNCWIFGSALAMILSYERSASILWAILHGIFSWFYIIYRAIQIWGWFGL